MISFQGTVRWEEVMKTLTEIGFDGDLVYEIKMNDYMPDPLKDHAAKFSAEVARYLLTLA